MTTASMLEMLENNPLFASLDKNALEPLLKKMKKVQLRKNEVLFRQGELSPALYFLIEGRLLGLLANKRHRERFIGYFDAGETIGELSALSNEPRAATMRAAEDSVLLTLPAPDFVAFCEKYPAILMATLQTVTARSHKLIELLETPDPAKRHIVILPGDEAMDLTDFTAKLTATIRHQQDVLVLSEFNGMDTATISVDDLQKKLTEKQSHCQKTIYILNLTNSALTKIAFDKADMVYIVANGDGRPHFSPKVEQALRTIDFAYRTEPALVLLHHEKKSLPTQTQAWLKLAKFGMNHHVRVTEKTDWQRLFRFITGKAIGVVLGGGGVRSWAHIGALKAIHEAGIPIDVVGGTSAGSIVGGYYALHETYDDAHGQLHWLSAVTRRAVSWWNLTWPAVSLFNGREYTATQKKIFGKATIENLWLPFFCITCDLAKSTEVINRTGPLWKKIRASTSVPGIFPPVIIHGGLRLDGGIANNLPVDVMRIKYPNVETVIAVQLVHNVKDDKKYKFPPALPFWKVVLTKLGLINKTYHFPHFIETFVRALLVGSSVKQRECAESADVLVSPDLSDYNLLSISDDDEKRLIELGYQATLKAIKKWQKQQ